MKITTVIFDIGGVLIGYSFTNYLMKLYKDPEKVAKIKDALFEHGVWTEVDRGVWTEEEIFEGFYKYGAGFEEEIKNFWDTIGDALWQYDFTKELIQSIKKKGVKVLYLSNWSQHLCTHAEKQMDFLPLMDGGVFSFKEHLVKPDREIYECILKKYNLRPEECVFLDDKPENTAAAISCGINAITVTDHEKAHSDLFKLLDME